MRRQGKGGSSPTHAEGEGMSKEKPRINNYREARAAAVDERMRLREQAGLTFTRQELYNWACEEEGCSWANATFPKSCSAWSGSPEHEAQTTRILLCLEACKGIEDPAAALSAARNTMGATAQDLDCNIHSLTPGLLAHFALSLRQALDLLTPKETA
jgi:hypothetical protein